MPALPDLEMDGWLPCYIHLDGKALRVGRVLMQGTTPISVISDDDQSVRKMDERYDFDTRRILGLKRAGNG